MATIILKEVFSGKYEKKDKETLRNIKETEKGEVSSPNYNTKCSFKEATLGLLQGTIK